MLHVEPLNSSCAKELSWAMRREDLDELTNMGLTSYEAMHLMLMDSITQGGIGNAWGVWSDIDGKWKGAFGYHLRGFVAYSLWAPLNRSESLQILRNTPKYVLKLLEDSRANALGNLIDVANHSALAWLRASKCFNIREDRPLVSHGVTRYGFTTKPATEIALLLKDEQ